MKIREAIVFFTLFFIVLIGAGFYQPGIVFSEQQNTVSADMDNQLNAAAGSGGANFSRPQDPRYIVSSIIKLALTLVGTVLFVLNVYAGYLWMTAGGNEEQVTQAKSTIKNGTIGLIVVLMSYTITIAVTNLASQRNLGQGTSRAEPYTIDDGVKGAAKGAWNWLFGK